MSALVTVKIPDNLYEIIQKFSSSAELDEKDVARKILLYVLKYQEENIDRMLNKMNGY